MCAFVDAARWTNVTVFLRRASLQAAFRALGFRVVARDLISGIEY
jgi:hypothetical protein